MNKKPVIAIDGFSSTGKSSISKVIAQKLDLIHIDTGALYRGITYFALENCLNDSQEIDIKSLFDKFDQIHLEFILNKRIRLRKRQRIKCIKRIIRINIKEKQC